MSPDSGETMQTRRTAESVGDSRQDVPVVVHPKGRRCQSGKNWRSYLDLVDERRIAEAGRSLRAIFDVDDMNKKGVLDIGCGSSLFSLAARRLGADAHSFSSNPDSVGCAEKIRRRHDPNTKR
jgi:2-polyprenyl-6-hydroxyphenyl methylase/3-demethylubiquinone-9 3-methyltransferase